MVSSINAINSSTGLSVQALTAATKAKLQKLSIDTSSIKTEAQGQAALLQASSGTDKATSTSNVDDANKASAAQSEKKPPSGEPPAWLSLMQSVGISPTGSKEGDKAAVSALIAGLDSKQAKAVASQFQAAGLSVKAAGEDTNVVNSKQEQDALAELNKHFIVK